MIELDCKDLLLFAIESFPDSIRLQVEELWQRKDFSGVFEEYQLICWWRW